MKTAMLRSISALWLVFTTAAFSQTVITTISVGTQPLGVAVNQKTNTVYVSNYQDNSVSVINAATNTVVATVAVGKGPQAILAYTPANLVYVNNVTDRTISVINGSTNTVVNTVKAPPITTWAQLGNSKYVYASNFQAGSVHVLDITRLKVVATIPVTGAWFVAVNPAAKLAYVTSQPQQIDVIDTTTNSVVNTFTAGSNTNVGSLSADPVNSLLYVASTPIGGNLQYSISVLNATTGTLLGTTTALGVVTVVQALSPARDAVVTGGKGSQQGYTLDRIFINGSTYNTMKTLQVGKNPGAIGYNQATKFLYVANGADNTVSVISY